MLSSGHFLSPLNNIYMGYFNCLPNLAVIYWVLEVCKSDPNPIGFVRILEQKYSFRIDKIVS